MRARQFAKRDGNKWLARYESGEHLKEIAADYGVSLSTVSRTIRQLGGVIRKQGFGSSNIRGQRNPAWKGGSHIKGGYRIVWVPEDHPLAVMRSARGYVAEHRLRMAQALGRPLNSNETVHHINGDRLDNSPQNLQLRQGKHGNGVHYRCGNCDSGNIVATVLG